MNQKVVVDIELEGFFCNHWPRTKITFNNQLIFFSEIENNKTLTFELDCVERNRITVEHVDKSFGENGVWDKTHDTECILIIKDIRLDKASIGTELLSTLTFITNWTQEQLKYHDQDFIQQNAMINHCMGQLNFNGVINFDFELPIYEWLIKEKFINPARKSGSNEMRRGKDKFDYEYIVNKISSIKKLF